MNERTGETPMLQGWRGGVCPSSMGRNLFFEKVLKLLQLFRANVRNSPVAKLRIKPMQKLITLVRDRLHGPVCSCPGRPNKQVNEVFAPLVNQRRHRPVIEIIKTATD